jgi:hypothetical protein
MNPEDRIPGLCSQLLRADNSAVIKTVAAEIKEAIDAYVERKHGKVPAIEPDVVTRPSLHPLHS